MKELPVQLELYHGSLQDVEPCFVGVDYAVMLEVIEHLEPDVLQHFPRTLFGIYKPEIVIISTPNREFNTLFEGLEQDKFRHYDHKFEWTRLEFQKWCEKVSLDYGYSVQYDGVGVQVQDCFDLKIGHATQIAIFTRLCHQVPSSIKDDFSSPQEESGLKLFYSQTYPYFDVELSNQEVFEIIHENLSLLHHQQKPLSLDNTWSILSTRQAFKTIDCFVDFLNEKPDCFQLSQQDMDPKEVVIEYLKPFKEDIGVVDVSSIVLDDESEEGDSEESSNQEWGPNYAPVSDFSWD